jgi:broad specificity phosphatase PhoE
VETIVHLIRHGRVYNPRNVRYGRAPGFHLSVLGRAQAHAAGVHLRDHSRPVAAVVSSPLERALETATIIARELAVPPPATDARLIEAANQLDGAHRWAFLSPRRWRLLWNPMQPSWGEPFDDIARRIRAVIDDVRARYLGAEVALVTHQAPIWIVRQSYERSGPPWLARVRCTQGSITSLRFDHARYVGHVYWAPAA